MDWHWLISFTGFQLASMAQNDSMFSQHMKSAPCFMGFGVAVACWLTALKLQNQHMGFEERLATTNILTKLTKPSNNYTAVQQHHQQLLKVLSQTTLESCGTMEPAVKAEMEQLLKSSAPVNSKLEQVIKLLTSKGLAYEVVLKPEDLLCHPANRGGAMVNGFDAWAKGNSVLTTGLKPSLLPPNSFCMEMDPCQKRWSAPGQLTDVCQSWELVGHSDGDREIPDSGHISLCDVLQGSSARCSWTRRWEGETTSRDVCSAGIWLEMGGNCSCCGNCISWVSFLVPSYFEQCEQYEQSGRWTGGNASNQCLLERRPGHEHCSGSGESSSTSLRSLPRGHRLLLQAFSGRRQVPLVGATEEFQFPGHYLLRNYDLFIYQL